MYKRGHRWCPRAKWAGRVYQALFWWFFAIVVLLEDSESCDGVCDSIISLNSSRNSTSESVGWKGMFYIVINQLFLNLLRSSSQLVVECDS